MSAIKMQHQGIISKLPQTTQGGSGWITVFDRMGDTYGVEIGDWNRRIRCYIDPSGCINLSQWQSPCSKMRVTFKGNEYGITYLEVCAGHLDANNNMLADAGVGIQPVTFGGNSQITIDDTSDPVSDEIPIVIDPNSFNGFWFGFKQDSGLGYPAGNWDNSAGTGGYKAGPSSVACDSSTSGFNSYKMVHIAKIEVFV